MTAYLPALGIICSLGADQASVSAALFAGDRSGMSERACPAIDRTFRVGAVTTPLPEIPASLRAHNTRNNRLLLAAALQIESEIRAAIQRFGTARVGVVLGTSTSGIEEATSGIAAYLQSGHFPADYSYQQQELGAPANFLAAWLELSGPAYAISSACTSSGRALLSARRLLDLGMCDAVLCGGVDSLCGLTLNGFAALEAMSPGYCNPFSANRDGINIGEGAALFLMTREPAAIALLGAGATSDAYHISAPEPQGLGAQRAMRLALQNADLQPEDIAYLNLHGTATTHNDSMESLAVAAVFPHGVPCSSIKALTGHTLGAAGAIEAAACWLTLSAANHEGRLPVQQWDGVADPQLPPLTLVAPEQRLVADKARYLMSNSFAFGGNNISLIIGDAP